MALHSLTIYLLNMIIPDPSASIYHHWQSRFADLARIQFLTLVGTTLVLPGSVSTFIVSCFSSFVMSPLVSVVSVLVPLSSLFNEDTLSFLLKFLDTWEQPLSTVILSFSYPYETYYLPALLLSHVTRWLGHPISASTLVFQNSRNKWFIKY